MDPSLTVLSSSASPADSPAGIHCANPDCRTRAGERSRGHQSCRALLCGHCCQNAARAAAEAGEQRPVCKVHARRVHTGHRPVPKDQAVQQVEANGCWTGGGGDAHELQDMFEKRTRLEQSLKRSLTMVVWYRNGCEPLRIAHEVTTFPLFQLQDFPDLVAELSLQPTSYIDAYNTETGQWEQHKISTVRTVEQDQRLLYRLRPSLLDCLTDCPGLDQELALQPHPITYQMKRQAEPYTPSPSTKQSRVILDPNPVHAPNLHSSAAVQPWDSPATGSPVHSTPGGWGPLPTGGLPAMNHASTSAVAQTDGYGSGAPGRRWPTDFTVREITAGFDAMAAIVRADTSARQKSAFERVFAPCRYVKSTVGRAKLYWKRAGREVRAHFLALAPDDARGRWTNFVHLMDGRLVMDLGREKAEEDDEKESVDGEAAAAAAAAANGARGFEPSQVTQPEPRANVRSPPTANVVQSPTHPPLPMSRQPTLPSEMLRQPSGGPLMLNPGPPLLHASSMPVPQSYTADRNLNLNRASSSLSGAITIPNH